MRHGLYVLHIPGGYSHNRIGLCYRDNGVYHQFHFSDFPSNLIVHDTLDDPLYLLRHIRCNRIFLSLENFLLLRAIFL